ncbi:hypothetical protein HMPREF9628_00996 [Peptoanaerobacter stomatis]|uniref:Flagellar hook protein FlgE n=1 Tax=Peptoanaerobacter stomatis TaxID=796937 RepID=G9XAH9_9FIRM|nr:flagellar hook protein FlgE [Peptoanaerobacter stomatis]EHL19999.1 hypothetical protein HMPREF9628_00996 [Peptoanaerobacter stomatis]
MMRSMNSAVSSLKNHQTRMDVIGNNIANVNTVAFKTGRVTFKDTYSQMVRTPSGHSENRGGINPAQVGLGMNISSIDNVMEKGTVDVTNVGTDVYIDGEGFFMVESSDGRYYTRDGNFNVDEEGYLTTQDGRYVMGYQADKDGNVIEKLSRIKVPIKDILKPKVTSKMAMEGNLSSKTAKGIPATGFPNTLATIYNKVPVDSSDPSKGYKYEIKPEFAKNEAAGRESILGKTTTTEVIDSLGGKHTIRMDFVRTADPNKWDVYAFYVDSNGSMIPASGTTVNTNPAASADGKALSGLTFKNTGGVDDTSPKEWTFSLTPPNGAAPMTNVKVDLSKLTQFESQSTAFVKENDGYTLGELNGMSIGSDGKIIGKFSNGDVKTLAQIVTATFANVNGLQKEGDNLWSPTQNSGDPNINVPGAGGSGMLQSNALEASNVDLAKEFTNMITTQRGFQANSRVITTTDQMLEELVNLKR